MIRILTISAVLFLVGCVGAPSSDNHSATNLIETSSLFSQEQPDWTKTEALNKYFREWEAVRYKFGGLSKEGVDCSGFVYLTFLNQFGVKLPRNTALQSKIGETVAQDELKTGDLVFFKTGYSRHTRHVGIYLDHGLFIHASTSQGVTTSSLDSEYWSAAYWKAKRLDPKVLQHS
jgi:cell wall-associated NlpC family hydrolase